ncbi:hypothetical protein CASFOL_013468 [Castilleja foliolosa]|uniref:Cytochrome P450 n=1 Tax=Castilleja foliolosa TaxID=1961234 RepID=A0ABD3DK51_9LAMI
MYLHLVRYNSEIKKPLLYNLNTHVRQKSVDELIEWIKRDVEKSNGNGGTVGIQLHWFLFATAFDTVGNLTLSLDVTGMNHDKASEFFEAFLMFFEWLGKANVADFFPVLKWMDPQGIKKNTGKYLERLIGFTSEIVKERIVEKESGVVRERDDFLDVLLDEGGVSDKMSVKNRLSPTIILTQPTQGDSNPRPLTNSPLAGEAPVPLDHHGLTQPKLP